jgi:hypothetical protein
MQPWIRERIERERQRQIEGPRIPLYIEPPTPRQGDEGLSWDPSHEEPRGYCEIDDTLDSSIDTAL